MKILITVLLTLIWIYVLRVTRKAELHSWRFIIGSFGLFALLMVTARPALTMPLARMVAAIAGVFGKLTGMFASYYKYGIIMVNSDSGGMTLLIDFECSGILEIMVFVCLLVFFRAYTVWEKILVGILGTLYLIFSNVLRLVIICSMIHIWGVPAYYLAHTIVGRVAFFFMSLMLYFYVFTKAQVIRQKVGGFVYGNTDRAS